MSEMWILTWKGLHIHLSNITRIYLYFSFPYTSSVTPYKHQTFVYTFPFPFLQPLEINYHLQQKSPTRIHM